MGVTVGMRWSICESRQVRTHIFRVSSSTTLQRYGRADAPDPKACSPEGNLPDGNPGPEGKFGGKGGTASTEATTPNEHLRKVFYRMGLNVSLFFVFELVNALFFHSACLLTLGPLSQKNIRTKKLWP